MGKDMMGSLEKNLEQHFVALVKQGLELVDIARRSDSGLAGEQLADVAAWLTRSQSLLKSLVSDGGSFCEQIKEVVDQTNQKGGFYNLHSSYHEHLAVAAGCLKGAYEDYKANRLT